MPSFGDIPGDYEGGEGSLSCFVYVPPGILPERGELTRQIVIITNMTVASPVLTFKSIYAPVTGLQRHTLSELTR